ncbi:hypothetical protein L3Y34_006776 [Caenorhabditis briggsae]|uniref:Uncharacterized protein n=1 Tax=Caenorhabditis briggsae TaxID=6238 RepID=A0AAE9CZY6_CAEBR|nr:hypothetical protein L3Y34_006776 [Caenorhabditis briggsae]
MDIDSVKQRLKWGQKISSSHRSVSLPRSTTAISRSAERISGPNSKVPSDGGRRRRFTRFSTNREPTIKLRLGSPSL